MSGKRVGEVASSAVIAVVMLGALAIPAPGAAQTKAPEGLATAFAQAWNSHDMEAFGKLFVDDADFVNVAATWWKGRAEIQSKHEQSHAMRFKQSSLVVSDTTVRKLRPDVAVIHVRWQLTGAVEGDGKPSPAREGVMQIVGVKEAGGWRIAAAQNTNQAPPR